MVRRARYAGYLLLLAWGLGHGWMGRALGLEVTEIRVATTEVEVGFRDESATGATAHRLEHAGSLAAPVDWVAMDGVRIDATGPGTFRAVAPRPVGSLGFFRLVARTEGGNETTSVVFEPGPLIAREGDSTGPRLVFSQPYTGVIRYVYSGPGFEQSGEVAVQGATQWALPPLNRPDDDSPGALEYASLRLERISGAVLEVAPPATVLVEDNDETWRGILVGDGSLGFSFLVLRQGASTQALIRGDATSLVPPGDYPASTFERSATGFQARIPNIHWEDGGPPFAGRVDGELLLETIEGEAEHQVGEAVISGRYTWRLVPVNRPHLVVMRTGGFVLQRQPNSAPVTKVPLVDAAP